MDLSKVVDVQMDEIELKGVNVRSDLDSQNSQEGLKELAENIKLNGLLQPIVLRGEFGKPPYDVIVGQRRYLAHKMLGAKEIKATFSGSIGDMDALLLSLSENMCRQEMNFEDTSNAITKLYNHFNKDINEVRKRTGFSLQMIRSHIKIEEQATEKIKGLLKEGNLSLIDAKRAIDAAQGDGAKADALVEEMRKLTTYEKKRLVETGTKNPKAKAEELVAEAKKPKFEETIILNLPLKVHQALKQASAKLALEIEEVTMNALVNWLKVNDYLIEA